MHTALYLFLVLVGLFVLTLCMFVPAHGVEYIVVFVTACAFVAHALWKIGR